VVTGHGIRFFCTFAGYTRSGHSVVAALIDAHPNAAVAHELDVFERDQRGRVTGRLRFAEREPMLRAVLDKSTAQAEAGRIGFRMHPDGRSYPVSYAVRNQHQGRFTELRVVGNKRGQTTLEAVRKNPDALAELERLAGVPLRILHVVRNPYDNIATKYAALTAGGGWKTPVNRLRSIHLYFRKARTVALIKAAGLPVHDVFLEDLIARPHAELARICGFLELPAHHDYLQDCASVVLPRPNRSAAERRWAAWELALIGKLMRQYPWLERYAEAAPAGGARKANRRTRT
jgi:hypothetical protein